MRCAVTLRTRTGHRETVWPDCHGSVDSPGDNDRAGGALAIVEWPSGLILAKYGAGQWLQYEVEA